jgi:hypothetical protein
VAAAFQPDVPQKLIHFEKRSIGPDIEIKPVFQFIVTLCQDAEDSGFWRSGLDLFARIEVGCHRFFGKGLLAEPAFSRRVIFSSAHDRFFLVFFFFASDTFFFVSGLAMALSSFFFTILKCIKMDNKSSAGKISIKTSGTFRPFLIK